MVGGFAVLAVAGIALGMALIPGPNLIYLISRTLEEGRRSGFIALVGVGAGYVLHLAVAVLGLSAALTAMPRLYSAIQLLGAGYLSWMAWRAVRTSAVPSFRTDPAHRQVSASSPIKLITMGALTNALNPKAPLMYASLLPQFIDLERGHVAAQALGLGGVHIAVSIGTHLVLVGGAGTFAAFLQQKPSWLRAQGYATGAVLALFAVHLVTTAVAPGTAPSPPHPDRPATGPAKPSQRAKYYAVGPPVDGQPEHLFSIAVKTLGDGRRYREISALNEGRLQSDGRRMSDPLVVEPGWVLLLPADARGPGVLKTPTAPASTSTRDRTLSGLDRALLLAVATLLAVNVLLLGGLLQLRLQRLRRERP